MTAILRSIDRLVSELSANDPPPQVAAPLTSGQLRAAARDKLKVLDSALAAHDREMSRFAELRSALATAKAEAARLAADCDPENHDQLRQLATARLQAELLPAKIASLEKSAQSNSPGLADPAIAAIPFVEELHRRTIDRLLIAPMKALEPLVSDEDDRRRIAQQTDAVRAEIIRQGERMSEVHPLPHGATGARLARKALGDALRVWDA